MVGDVLDHLRRTARLGITRPPRWSSGRLFGQGHAALVKATPQAGVMSSRSIGELVALPGMSTDTLRYYEKIGLLLRALRGSGGRCRYSDADLVRLLFNLRAQAMNFSLAEIGHLLQLCSRPHQARTDVRRVAEEKLTQVEVRMKTLRLLRNEPHLLLNLCAGSEVGCPILESLDSGADLVRIMAAWIQYPMPPWGRQRWRGGSRRRRVRCAWRNRTG